MIYNFEELVVWQLSRKLVKDIYLSFADIRDYGYNDQIERAAVSVMNNIAEGFQKHKHSKDNKQFINFLNISYGSCGEVRSMLYIAKDLGYILDPQPLQDQCLEIEIKLEKLINSLQTSTKFRAAAIAKPLS